MVHAVAQSFAQRFPLKEPRRGRPPVSPRVLLALELLKHELGASDEDICQRLRTDVAVSCRSLKSPILEFPANPRRGTESFKIAGGSA